MTRLVGLSLPLSGPRVSSHFSPLSLTHRHVGPGRQPLTASSPNPHPCPGHACIAGAILAVHRDASLRPSASSFLSSSCCPRHRLELATPTDALLPHVACVHRCCRHDAQANHVPTNRGNHLQLPRALPSSSSLRRRPPAPSAMWMPLQDLTATLPQTTMPREGPCELSPPRALHVASIVRCRPATASLTAVRSDYVRSA
jgi:hypothetical protein